MQEQCLVQHFRCLLHLLLIPVVRVLRSTETSMCLVLCVLLRPLAPFIECQVSMQQAALVLALLEQPLLLASYTGNLGYHECGNLS
jgi:hypothetical protein